MKTKVKTLKKYTESKHKLFTYEFIPIKNTIYVIYKNKGFTEKSTVYGTIFQINYNNDGLSTLGTFRTKKQVLNFLSKK
jgi:hypothetical protein